MAKILLVDDDPDILQVARALLASQGHDVLVAADALQALDLLRSYGCDAMITDLNMPHYSGYDLVKTIRLDKAWTNLPIAMLTGRRDKKDIEQALALGVDDYIVKPIDPPLFLKKVEALLTANDVEGAKELNLAQTQSPSPGRLNLPIHMKSISELGLTFTSLHKIAEGQLIDLSSHLFEQVGIAPPRMKTLSCVPTLTGDGYETRVLFIGVDDSVLQKIRAWVFANTVRKKPAA